MSKNKKIRTNEDNRQVTEELLRQKMAYYEALEKGEEPPENKEERDITVFVFHKDKGKTVTVRQFSGLGSGSGIGSTSASVEDVRQRKVKELYTAVKLAHGIAMNKVIRLFRENGRVTDVDQLEPEELLAVRIKGEPSGPVIDRLKKEVEKVRAEEAVRKAKEEAKKKKILENYRKNQKALAATNEQQRRLIEASERTFECSICMSDVPAREIYAIEGCAHKFCPDCVAGYLESEILSGAARREARQEEARSGPDTGSTSTSSASSSSSSTATGSGDNDIASVGIKCPAYGCKQIIQYPEIKRCVSKELFAKYDAMLRDHAVEASGDLVWCPTPGCGNAIFKPNKDENPMLVCYACKFSYCMRCETFWHADSTCEKFLEWKRIQGLGSEGLETLFRAWLSENASRCPACLVPIEKDGGCNHMTCQRCGHEFCWLCGEDYDEGRHFRRGGCSQWS